MSKETPMPEEATTTPEETQATTQQTVETTETVERKDPPEQNLVGEAKRKQKQAEKEAAELRARLEELEDKDKSETERERKAREKAEAQAAELGAKVHQLERGGWVRSAAAAEGFNDPDDAVAFADLSDIESADDAKRAVKDIAKRKPHLLKPKEPARPEIGRVLEEGRQVTPDRQQAGPTQAERDAEVVRRELEKLGVFPS